MHGQPSAIQISTSETPGDDIITPPKNVGGADNKFYLGTFWAEIAPDVMGLFCKESNGTVHPVSVNGIQVTCDGGAVPIPLTGPLSQFGFFWQEVDEVTGTIAANNGKALFFNSSSNNTAGLTTVAGSGDIVVGATAGGIYDINWQVAGAEPNAFAIFINGVIAAGSVNGSGAGTQQNNGSTLLRLAAGDVVSLRSDNAPAAITLQLAGTTDTNQKVTEIMFKKLAN